MRRVAEGVAEGAAEFQWRMGRLRPQVRHNLGIVLTGSHSCVFL